VAKATSVGLVCNAMWTCKYIPGFRRTYCLQLQGCHWYVHTSSHSIMTQRPNQHKFSLVLYLTVLCRWSCQNCKSTSHDGRTRPSHLFIYNKLPPSWSHISHSYLRSSVPSGSCPSGKLKQENGCLLRCCIV
jgi:hypothetical protein